MRKIDMSQRWFHYPLSDRYLAQGGKNENYTSQVPCLGSDFLFHTLFYLYILSSKFSIKNKSPSQKPCVWKTTPRHLCWSTPCRILPGDGIPKLCLSPPSAPFLFLSKSQYLSLTSSLPLVVPFAPPPSTHSLLFILFFSLLFSPLASKPFLSL